MPKCFRKYYRISFGWYVVTNFHKISRVNTALQTLKIAIGEGYG